MSPCLSKANDLFFCSKFMKYNILIRLFDGILQCEMAMTNWGAYLQKQSLFTLHYSCSGGSGGGGEWMWNIKHIPGSLSSLSHLSNLVGLIGTLPIMHINICHSLLSPNSPQLLKTLYNFLIRSLINSVWMKYICYLMIKKK